MPGRGTLMGNRGILHDDHRTIVRPWHGKRWIACVLQFKGRHRVVMRPHTYTELFFLDEATAFAAGHRPCAECRRADFERFRDLWTSSFGGTGRVDPIDATLHEQRLDGRRKRTYRERIGALPRGTFVALDDSAWLVAGSHKTQAAGSANVTLLRWTDGGYTDRRTISADTSVGVLTPPALVRMLAAGYRPLLHASARDAR